MRLSCSGLDGWRRTIRCILSGAAEMSRWHGRDSKDQGCQIDRKEINEKTKVVKITISYSIRLLDGPLRLELPE